MSHAQPYTLRQQAIGLSIALVVLTGVPLLAHSIITAVAAPVSSSAQPVSGTPSDYVEVTDRYDVQNPRDDWAMLRAAYQSCYVNNYDDDHAYACQLDAYNVATHRGA